MGVFSIPNLLSKMLRKISACHFFQKIRSARGTSNNEQGDTQIEPNAPWGIKGVQTKNNPGTRLVI